LFNELQNFSSLSGIDSELVQRFQAFKPAAKARASVPEKPLFFIYIQLVGLESEGACTAAPAFALTEGSGLGAVSAKCAWGHRASPNID
jgi:hypothetical protein